MSNTDTALPRVPLSLRLPKQVVETVDDYARVNRLSKTDAFLHFLQKGIDVEEGSASSERLSEIERQLEQIKEMLSRDKTSRAESQAAVLDLVRQEARGFSAIKRAYVFGSFARGDFDEQSDVDVRLDLDAAKPFSLRDLAQFQKGLERATGCSVDVVSAKNLKNENLAAAIEKDKVLAYER